MCFILSVKHIILPHVQNGQPVLSVFSVLFLSFAQCFLVT